MGLCKLLRTENTTSEETSVGINDLPKCKRASCSWDRIKLERFTNDCVFVVGNLNLTSFSFF